MYDEAVCGTNRSQIIQCRLINTFFLERDMAVLNHIFDNAMVYAALCGESSSAFVLLLDGKELVKADLRPVRSTSCN